MKTVLFFLLTGVVALIAGGCASGESFARTGYDFSKVTKVAVVDVTGKVGSEGVKNQISDFFVMEFLRKGYAPVERNQVQALLAEQDFQHSEVTSHENAAEIGQLLNVAAVVVVNVGKYDDEITMTAKMIDVTDASILWMGSGTGQTGGWLFTLGGAAAGAIGGATVGGDNADIGAVAGGVLGATAGQAMSPQTATQAREVIKKICESLPPASASSKK